MRTRTLTPGEVREILRVSEDKVLGWIRSGELAAFDVASKGSRKPRYRIEESALRDFIRVKSIHAKPPVTTRRARKDQVPEYV